MKDKIAIVGAGHYGYAALVAHQVINDQRIEVAAPVPAVEAERGIIINSAFDRPPYVITALPEMIDLKTLPGDYKKKRKPNTGFKVGSYKSKKK